MPLVECLLDEEDAGAAGCSKDKKLHDISLSAGRPRRPISPGSQVTVVNKTDYIEKTSQQS
jgi:hypothetical protein